MSGNKEFVGFGEIWDGRNEIGSSTHREISPVRSLIPETVSDSEMNCGGRNKMHEDLSSDKRGVLFKSYCGSCAVKKSCILGSAMNFKKT